jgi:hypothetical protein
LFVVSCVSQTSRCKRSNDELPSVVGVTSRRTISISRFVERTPSAAIVDGTAVMNARER